jgi:uncharacterized damage-inducible protein DinB
MKEVERFAEKIESEGEKTIAFFAALPDRAWPVRLYADGAEWTVQQVLGHIVEAEGSFLRLFGNITRGGTGVSKEFDIDSHNATQVAKLDAMTPAALLAEFANRRREMTAFIRALEDPDLLRFGRHPYLGETTINEMLRLFTVHISAHIRDVRRAIKEGEHG